MLVLSPWDCQWEYRRVAHDPAWRSVVDCGMRRPHVRGLPQRTPVFLCHHLDSTRWDDVAKRGMGLVHKGLKYDVAVLMKVVITPA